MLSNRSVALAAVALAITPVVACAQLRSRRMASSTEWIPFRWAGSEIAGRYEPRAALLVPVSLDGLPGSYYLQLDTGAGWPRWYEIPFRQLAPALLGSTRATAPDELVAHGHIGQVTLSADTFLIAKGFGDSLPSSGNQSSAEPRVIGTLGLRFFRSRVLVLDFAGQRLAIVDSGRPLPDEIPGGIVWLPARYEHGYLFVPFVAAGQRIDDFFFDSGASAFPLTTTSAEWRVLTSRADTEPDLVRYQVSSWGKQVTEIAAPLTGDVVFGPYRFARPLVFHQREQPDFFTSAPYHLGGHFGNALFFDHYVIIIDLPGRRFGLVSGRARPGPSTTQPAQR